LALFQYPLPAYVPSNLRQIAELYRTLLIHPISPKFIKNHHTLRKTLSNSDPRSFPQKYETFALFLPPPLTPIFNPTRVSRRIRIHRHKHTHLEQLASQILNNLSQEHLQLKLELEQTALVTSRTLRPNIHRHQQINRLDTAKHLRGLEVNIGRDVGRKSCGLGATGLFQRRENLSGHTVHGYEFAQVLRQLLELKEEANLVDGLTAAFNGRFECGEQQR